MATLEKAILIAVHAHHGQTDKAGDPYILHSLRVMLHMTHETEMVAAVLSDDSLKPRVNMGGVVIALIGIL